MSDLGCSMVQDGCPITSVFFLVSLVSFFWGSLVSFFLGRLRLFCCPEATVSSESPFWPALGCRSGFTPGFLSLGFRFGLTLFRASAWVSSFLGFRLSFKLAFASFRVLGWVYSVFSMGFLSLGFGLALLLLRLRPGFDRFWGFGFLSSLPFPSFRVSVSEYSFFP